MPDGAGIVWPGVLAQVARVASDEAAFQMAVNLGGTELHVPTAAHLRRSQGHVLVRAIGIRAAIAVSQGVVCRGTVYVPQARRACVLMLARRGFQDRDICARLGLSYSAVRRYRRAM